MARRPGRQPRRRSTSSPRNTGRSTPRAVECLTKDREALLAFYDFPAEHWDHLRTSNPIESVFATVRHRTVRTKGALSPTTARLMVFKLVMAASKTWRRLKGENQLPKVIAGVTFRDGDRGHRDAGSTRRLTDLRHPNSRIARQGDSVLRVGIGVSAIHALGDGRWRPGMSGSDGARGADLWEVFSVVPDHRRAEGKRYPLAGLLMIALAAMLAGRSDQLGIVRWGRKLSREALAELGILRGRVPAPSVWSELFRALDVGALERLLGAWVKGAGAAGHVAIDGKRLRGSAVGDVPGVHLLAAFSERLQGVIGQLRVAPEANEITAALTLLKTLPIEGAIISGDAIFAQTDLCRLIIERGGDYFFTVKSNQPTLEADIALAFRPDSPLCGVGARA